MPKTLFTPAAIVAGSVVAQIALRPSSAVSIEAISLQEGVRHVEEHYERSVALFGVKSRLLNSLRELAEECMEEDWDGYGARPLTSVVSARAEAFVRAMPDWVPAPELSVDPDGEVSFDWIPTVAKTFTLSVNGSNRLAYAWIDGADRGHAVVFFGGDAIPSRVLAEIERITAHGSVVRVA